jgi:hypothetical protein
VLSRDNRFELACHALSPLEIELPKAGELLGEAMQVMSVQIIGSMFLACQMSVQPIMRQLILFGLVQRPLQELQIGEPIRMIAVPLYVPLGNPRFG